MCLKLSIENLMAEIKPVLKRQGVLKSIFSRTNGTFSHFRFISILMQGTKSTVMQSSTPLQVKNFRLDKDKRIKARHFKAK